MKKKPKVFHLLQRAHAALFRASDRISQKQLGISSAQHAVLFALMREDGIPIMKVGEQLKMGKSSVSELVDRMSEAGLVRRAASTEDKRVKLLYLEPSGRAIAEVSLSAIKRINEALLAPYDEDQRSVILGFLERIADHADEIIGRDFIENHTQTNNRKVKNDE